MSTCTWEDLRTIMADCAGAADNLASATPTTTFSAMGYDSLAILETACALERRYQIALPDEQVGDVTTPQAFLDLINGQLV